MRTTIFAKLFLILGVVSITYGMARWQIVTEVLSRQERHFQQFATSHTTEFSQPTNSAMAHDLGRLRMQVMLSGGLYSGMATGRHSMRRWTDVSCGELLFCAKEGYQCVTRRCINSVQPPLASNLHGTEVRRQE